MSMFKAERNARSRLNALACAGLRAIKAARSSDSVVPAATSSVSPSPSTSRTAAK
ncbi:hypothetical protein GALL_396850 [mine drainage metagenome]|uniref:Uncharacterized protein n=1 Tax=mine drainage metagenome TaxID=410659 RepID=A0A1J5QM73_9ZZZZ